MFREYRHVAQRIEQPPSKRMVVGSIPTVPILSHKECKMKLRPQIAARELLFVDHNTSTGATQKLVLCTQCLSKRAKKTKPWNRSSRQYDCGKYVGYTSSREPKEYYLVSREEYVKTQQGWRVAVIKKGVKCHDCGWKPT